MNVLFFILFAFIIVFCFKINKYFKNNKRNDANVKISEEIKHDLKDDLKENDKQESNISYSNLLKSPEWKNKREEILKLHNYKCDWCGTTENLQIHHKKYLKYPNGNKVDPWDYENKDLMCLCNKCHYKYHKKYKVYTFYTKYKTKS